MRHKPTDRETLNRVRWIIGDVLKGASSDPMMGTFGDLLARERDLKYALAEIEKGLLDVAWGDDAEAVDTFDALERWVETRAQEGWK